LAIRKGWSPAWVTSSVAGCHGQGVDGEQVMAADLTVAIVGQPNVGKSVLFNALTHARVAVANYPGTTVELLYGRARGPNGNVTVVDMPGMYSFVPATEEERVAARFLLEQAADVVVHVADAKHLDRMLAMTFELLEAGLPTVLVVNFMDEAERLGLRVDAEGLSAALGIPVVLAALRYGRGVDALWEALARARRRPRPSPRSPVTYPAPIEEAVARMAPHLPRSARFSARGLALLLLAGDEDAWSYVANRPDANLPALRQVAEEVRAQLGEAVAYVIAQQRHQAARRLAQRFVRAGDRASGYIQKVDAILLHPVAGLPVLFLVMGFIYLMVGVLGAQVLVEWLEGGVFEARVNPWVDGLLSRWVPWPAVRDLFGGEYGIFTLGVRYAVAIILPVVGTFFLAFSVLEDSGYLPRLALLVDRVFKRMGLNGRAVIPLVLGLGCDTMATVVTRTLESWRERVISTLLLALAVPCSAQLGVMLGLLGGSPLLLALWTGVVAGVFLLVGWLAAQVLPGERPVFYVELPPLRWPDAKSVLVKTYARVEWYLREVLPLFVLASVLIWIGRLTGAFDMAIRGLAPVVRWVGLPDEAAVAILFGFFRRDYGAAGLYDLRPLLTPAQRVVAATTLTLFVPCVAQFAVMWKERGPRTALAMVAFIFPFAFLVGGVLYRVLLWLGMS